MDVQRGSRGGGGVGGGDGGGRGGGVGGDGRGVGGGGYRGVIGRLRMGTRNRIGVDEGCVVVPEQWSHHGGALMRRSSPCIPDVTAEKFPHKDNFFDIFIRCLAILPDFILAVSSPPVRAKNGTKRTPLVPSDNQFVVVRSTTHATSVTADVCCPIDVVEAGGELNGQDFPQRLQ